MAQHVHLDSHLMRDFLSFILSLPSRMHNALQLNTPGVFAVDQVRHTVAIVATQFDTHANQNYLAIATDLLYHQEGI